MKIKKILANVMCASLILSNLIVVNASNVIINESPIDDEGIAIVSDTGSDISTETGWTTDERNLSDVEVTYQQSSNYSVTIPKTITLASNKRAGYSVKVSGDIDTTQRVYVAPVDIIPDTEEVDFYMKDQNGKKDDVVATVTQNKLYWNSEEVTSGYEETDNSISALDLTSGTWKGTFQVEIKLQTEKAHEHTYVDGVCSCGEIDPKHTHNYVDGACIICGDKEHTHNYIDGICGCGEIDPNHTHDYINGTCSICKQQQEAGLYDANNKLLVSWEASGISNNCVNAWNIINKTYPTTTKVIMDDSVESIAATTVQSAFYGCTNLTDVVISDSVTIVGDSAFSGCTSLKNVKLGNGITEIGKNSFAKCSSLREINVPDSVTNIGSQAFNGCSSLESVNIGNSVTNIDAKAFYECTELADVVIGNSVTNIGENAFNRCSALKSIEVPNSVKSIDNSAFAYCTSLTDLVINNSPTSIGNYAFIGCSSLRNIEFGNSVTSIGTQAFLNCESLINVIIPDSVTVIEQQAFAGCTALKSAEVPSSVKSTNGLMFANCTSLEKATVAIPTIDYRMFRGCTSLKEVILSNDVTSIGAEAFYDCASLDIEIPDSVTSIANNAFTNVPHITYSGTATGSPWGAKSIN